MNESLIKSIALSKGWGEVEVLLRKEFNNIEINTKVGCLEIGKKYLAKCMARTALEKVLRKINNIKNEKKKNIVKYV